MQTKPNLPKFITFTGVDEFTSIAGMIALSQLYPIEWGILFSPKNQGRETRYPPMGAIYSFFGKIGYLHLSAHLCGGYSRDLIEYGQLPALEHMLGGCFHRVQVNTADPNADPEKIGPWARRFNAQAIMQSRREFPIAGNVQWLHDTSGGRGILSAAWPKPPDKELYGYAGGLNPKNVGSHVDVIGTLSDNYWIDMETGVRDANDRFDLGLCKEVCEQVYGVPSNVKWGK